MGAQIEIDIEAASVVSVSAKQEAGAYKKGDTIQISVEFDRPVTTTGKAELTLNTDPEVIAEAPAVSGSKTLEFTYTVGEENTASGSCLDYVSRDSLSLEDGASADSSGHAVSLSLPEPGTETSLGSAGIVIDTVSPAVQRTNRNSSASGYYKESK